jgi:4-amino-4-deoxy-L-arabinose transferase-like glycosyltransferase
MNTAFLPKQVYFFLFSLLGIVYITGFFVPLMDNDSAHHADIALHMYLTNDFVNLIDNGKDYLDKPHLHFWLCALSYHLFGVTSFAYKFPSLLFTVLGVWSVFRLGKILYNVETGRLAALLISSAFAFILANNDVRMDAILTACVAFATWQLVELIQSRKFINIIGASLGLALGFATKGHIAVFTPAVGIFFYLLYRKDWAFFYSWQLLLLILFFAVFISPVVYCYYLQFNLHPEKVVRGKDHINGVLFILLGQSVERFQGDSFGSDAKNDYLFFIHSFLWAFAPWSILTYFALFDRIRNWLTRSQEWLTTATIIIIALLLSFSGFKLPHYLNITFPAAAVVTAAWIIGNVHRSKLIFRIQAVIVILLLIIAALVNAWFFPVKNWLIFPFVIILLAAVIYFYKSQFFTAVQKAVCMSAAAISLVFFLLNANFYPQLLTYQAGNELAKRIKGTIDPSDIYFWPDVYSSSFCFYTATLRNSFSDSAFSKGRPVWVMIDKKFWPEVQKKYTTGMVYTNRDYEITRLQLKFLLPEKRKSQLTEMMLIELKKNHQ